MTKQSKRARDNADSPRQSSPEMTTTTTIPLRFHRAELEQKAELSPAGLERLAAGGRPEQLIEALVGAELVHDAASALAMILPHRQSVWWACLSVGLLPDLAERPQERAAVEAASRWVQTVSPADAEGARIATEACDLDRAAAWTAMGAFWAGPTLAPRGQQAVAPAPHLPGVATRTALLLLGQENGLADRVTLRDLLSIGLALMHGETGQQAQAALKARLA